MEKKDFSAVCSGAPPEEELGTGHDHQHRPSQESIVFHSGRGVPFVVTRGISEVRVDGREVVVSLAEVKVWGEEKVF